MKSYYVEDWERDYKRFFFDSHLLIPTTGSTSPDMEGRVKWFLLGKNRVLLDHSSTVDHWSVHIDGQTFSRQDVQVKRVSHLACFDVYTIRTPDGTRHAVDFNYLDYLFKYLDPTWDDLDEEFGESFLETFS